ncbi:DUF262 domain-containing protein [Curtobacterium sp. 1P10AnD]|uniref:DUF262 domain-containing protein n=1 Tax=Curtobacterium sp. 1P10AnD TaxID=3132283 RepID=UPI0039A02EBA
MSLQVEASTIRAGALFSENRFFVPDFQRKYSWKKKEQVAEFWDDLQAALAEREYFLGLVILSKESESGTAGNQREVVDGQQRLVTLSVLANVLRLKALHLGRRLVAEGLRSDFLFAIDYQTEEQFARLKLTDASDSEDLEALFSAESVTDVQLREGSLIHAAHELFLENLGADLASANNAALRVGQWADFISKQLSFAVFTHPDRGAAFRVYEVVNTRGKELTPGELIKSFVIGNSGSSRDVTFERWNNIEGQLEAVGGLAQLTTFVRHVVTLRRGYVIPRELYQEVTVAYSGQSGVSELLDSLETFLPVYMQMLDQTADVESSEVRARAFAIFDTLSLARFRPILLAAAFRADADELYEKICGLVVPGAITGAFGTGSVEAQFARATRRILRDDDWEGELRRLADLRPSRDEFVNRLKRGVNKQQARVLLSAATQRSSLPSLVGYAHQVRPKSASAWATFTDADYERAGTLLGNWVLTSAERRPQGAKTPEIVGSKLLSDTVNGSDLASINLLDWTVSAVERRTEELRALLVGIWYASE